MQPVGVDGEVGSSGRPGSARGWQEEAGEEEGDQEKAMCATSHSSFTV